MRDKLFHPDENTYVRSAHFRRRWKRIAGVLSFFVALGTVGALTFPGIACSFFL